MKELNIKIEYPDKFKSKEILSAVQDYLLDLVHYLNCRIAYRVCDVEDD